MEAFLFDMDGVLADNTAYHVAAWQEYARRLGRPMTEDEVKRHLGFTNAGYLAFILGRDPTPAEVARAESEKEALYRDLFRPHLTLPPGLLDWLGLARRRGIACAVATAAPPENVAFVLDGLGIRPYFQAVVDDTQFKRGKPAPDCYLAAAAKLGIPPADCTVFEDAIAGIQAGKAAGMRVTAITTSYPPDVLSAYHPDRIIASFRDLLTAAENAAAR